jgi:hypothetical protein
VLPGIFAISDEKSVVSWLTDSRVTLMPFALRAAWTVSDRPC